MQHEVVRHALIYMYGDTDCLVRILSDAGYRISRQSSIRRPKNRLLAKVNDILFYGILSIRCSLGPYTHLFTVEDNNLMLIRLPVFYCKKVLVQNGARSALVDVFYNCRSNATRLLSYINRNSIYLCLGSHVGELYTRTFGGKYIATGALSAICFRHYGSNGCGRDKLAIDFLYVSSFREQYMGEFRNDEDTFSWEKYIEGERYLIENIVDYLKGSNRRLTVLITPRKSRFEKIFFENAFEGLSLDFIESDGGFAMYEALMNAKKVIALDSTIGYIALSMGLDVAHFGGLRGESFPYNTRRYGWPAELPLDGPFWCGTRNSAHIRDLLCGRLIRQSSLSKVALGYTPLMSYNDVKLCLQAL
jgi:surface carbohydrate biosynthesis protein